MSDNNDNNGFYLSINGIDISGMAGKLPDNAGQQDIDVTAPGVPRATRPILEKPISLTVTYGKQRPRGPRRWRHAAPLLWVYSRRHTNLKR